jgi:hypothetical protein
MIIVVLRSNRKLRRGPSAPTEGRRRGASGAPGDGRDRPGRLVRPNLQAGNYTKIKHWPQYRIAGLGDSARAGGRRGLERPGSEAGASVPPSLASSIAGRTHPFRVTGLVRQPFAAGADSGCRAMALTRYRRRRLGRYWIPRKNAAAAGPAGLKDAQGQPIQRACALEECGNRPSARQANWAATSRSVAAAGGRRAPCYGEVAGRPMNGMTGIPPFGRSGFGGPGTGRWIAPGFRGNFSDGQSLGYIG